MSNSKRNYNSTGRLLQAQKTKERILASAKKLFKTDGFEGVTIEKLAKDADVSEPTIYALFKSKRGVLRAVLDEALPQEQFEALVKRAMGEKSPKDRLLFAAKIARQIYDTEKNLMEFFQSASLVAPEFKELEKEKEARRFKRQGDSIKMLSQEQALKKDLTLAKARDLLWAYTGRDFYRLLVIERKWSSDEYESWLADQLQKTLLD